MERNMQYTASQLMGPYEKKGEDGERKIVKVYRNSRCNGVAIL